MARFVTGSHRRWPLPLAALVRIMCTLAPLVAFMCTLAPELGAAPATAPSKHAAAPASSAAHRASAVGKPGAARPAAKRPAATHAQLLAIAKTAVSLEELGAYARAADALRGLRLAGPADLDLDLQLALDLARSGHPDSAAALMWTPAFERALADSTPVLRRQFYPWERQEVYIDGYFEGWTWYVARARAELAAALGRWSDARAAAEACVKARPQSGKDWLLLAVCEGREGHTEDAARAARTAAELDPTLPEALYLSGLYDWREGRRMAAQQSFRRAVALDSTWQVPALALVRSRLPGIEPDSLPAELLNGLRAAALLTSPAGPKVEEFTQMDEASIILSRNSTPIPDSLILSAGGVDLAIPVLVDTRGRAVLNELPWVAPAQLPPALASAVVASLEEWRFRPARKNGAPHPVWATIEYTLKLPGASGAAAGAKH